MFEKKIIKSKSNFIVSEEKFGSGNGAIHIAAVNLNTARLKIMFVHFNCLTSLLFIHSCTST